MRRAYPHELVKGAVIRCPAGPGYRSRPFGLEIAHREPDSKEAGAITVSGRLLAQDGTTARARPPYRTVVIATWMEPPALIRKAPPPEFTAMIATLLRQVPDEAERTMADMTTRWAVVSKEAGVALPALEGGTGPAVIEQQDGSRWVTAGDWDGKPTPWLAKELAEKTPEEQRQRRDPIDQCIDRVRQERGILHLERLTYDLSAWTHSSAQELREVRPGVKAWRDTHECRRCGLPLKLVIGTGRFTGLDGDSECHGATWAP